MVFCLAVPIALQVPMQHAANSKRIDGKISFLRHICAQAILLESFLCLSLSAIPFPLSELLEGSYHYHRIVLRCQPVQNVAVRLWPGLIDFYPFRILSHHA